MENKREKWRRRLEPATFSLRVRNGSPEPRQLGTKLSSGPLALAVAAQLNLVAATARDFSFLAAGPDAAKSIASVKNPRSFKATVAQVSNEMFRAFLSADEAMGDIMIRMSPGHLPTNVGDIVELIEEGTAKEVQEELPDEIKKVNETLDACVGHSEKVVKDIDRVARTLEEMLELTAAAQGGAQNDRAAFANEVEAQKCREKHLAERMEELKKDVSKVEKKLDEEEKVYKGRLEDLGSQNRSGWEGIIWDVFGSKNIRLRLDHSKQDVKARKEELDKLKERQLENNQEMLKAVLSLGEFKGKEATAAHTLEMATKALQALGRTKQHWADMLLYFRGAKQIIDLALRKPLEQLVDCGDLAKKRRLDGDALSGRFMRKLRSAASEAERIVELLFHFSGCYSQFSRQFLMPMVSSLGALISMSDKGKIRDKQKEIKEMAAGMQGQIESMIKENHTRLNSRLTQS